MKKGETVSLTMFSTNKIHLQALLKLTNMLSVVSLIGIPPPQHHLKKGTGVRAL